MPPPPAEKMRVPGGAYSSKVVSPKVAAAEKVEKETPKKDKKIANSSSASESLKSASVSAQVNTSAQAKPIEKSPLKG